jgi:hypothetical protein
MQSVPFAGYERYAVLRPTAAVFVTLRVNFCESTADWCIHKRTQARNIGPLTPSSKARIRPATFTDRIQLRLWGI